MEITVTADTTNRQITDTGYDFLDRISLADIEGKNRLAHTAPQTFKRTII